MELAEDTKRFIADFNAKVKRVRQQLKKESKNLSVRMGRGTIANTLCIQGSQKYGYFSPEEANAVEKITKQAPGKSNMLCLDYSEIMALDLEGSVRKEEKKVILKEKRGVLCEVTNSPRTSC